KTAISMLYFYESLKNSKLETAVKQAQILTMEEKYSEITNKFKIDLTSYPLAFWRGIACFRSPKIIKTEFGNEVKNKLTINDELPFFNKDQDFLYNIINK